MPHYGLDSGGATEDGRRFWACSQPRGTLQRSLLRQIFAQQTSFWSVGKRKWNLFLVYWKSKMLILSLACWWTSRSPLVSELWYPFVSFGVRPIARHHRRLGSSGTRPIAPIPRKVSIQFKAAKFWIHSTVLVIGRDHGDNVTEYFSTLTTIQPFRLSYWIWNVQMYHLSQGCKGKTVQVVFAEKSG